MNQNNVVSIEGQAAQPNRVFNKNNLIVGVCSMVIYQIAQVGLLAAIGWYADRKEKKSANPAAAPQANKA